MALQDILAAITALADQRIADARQAHKQSLTQLREDSERSLATKKQELASQKQKKMNQLAAKANTHAHAVQRNAILQKKKELLDRTYAEVMKELTSLDAKDLETLLRACLKRIKHKGEIHPSKKHADLLKKICPSEQFTMKDATNAKGGFLFISDKEDQDFTFEYLVEHELRPKTELTTSQLLFS